jgi:hypothetical protein
VKASVVGGVRSNPADMFRWEKPMAQMQRTQINSLHLIFLISCNNQQSKQSVGCFWNPCYHECKLREEKCFTLGENRRSPAYSNNCAVWDIWEKTDPGTGIPSAGHSQSASVPCSFLVCQHQALSLLLFVNWAAFLVWLQTRQMFIWLLPPWPGQPKEDPDCLADPAEE